MVDFLISKVLKVKDGILPEQFEFFCVAKPSERIKMARFVVNDKRQLLFESLSHKIGIFGEADFGIKTADDLKDIFATTDHGPEGDGLFDKVSRLNQQIEVGGNGLVVALIRVRIAPASEEVYWFDVEVVSNTLKEVPGKSVIGIIEDKIMTKSLSCSKVSLDRNVSDLAR